MFAWAYLDGYAIDYENKTLKETAKKILSEVTKT